MLRSIHIIYYLILLTLYSLSSVTFAALQLQASVEPVQVAIGETLQLNLELSGISNQDLQQPLEPDLTPLQDLFTARGQNRFESSHTVNGVTTHQIRWQYTLEPQKVGTLTIPALSLKTTTGRIFSQPLTITVSDARSQTADSSSYIETIISNDKPYLYQPIYYTIRLYHRGDLRDPEPLPPTNDVILEGLTKWGERHEQINGKQMVINEIVYLLTPLKSGKLELTPGRVKALKPENKRYSTGFGFSMFTDYLPVALTGSPLTLQVRPPAVSQQPWLPLKKLHLTQKWGNDLSQPVTVGVPLVRTLTLTAEGMGGQPLPELDHLLESDERIRVRSPKPDIKRTVLADGKTPVSELQQSFSITPLTVGVLQLPALRLPWWDVEKNKLAWAELPAQMIQVVDNSGRIPSLKNVETPVAVPTPQVTSLHFIWPQYVLLTSSLISLFIALGYSWYQRWPSQVKLNITLPTPAIVSTALFKQRLLVTEELADVKQLIQIYAQSHWQTPRYASLQTIGQRLIERYDYGCSAAQLLKQLNDAIYGHQPLELSIWKSLWIATLNQLECKTAVTQIAENALEPFNYH